MGKTVSTSKHSEPQGSGANVTIARGYIVSDGTGGFKFSGTGPGDIHLVSDGLGGYVFDSSASAGDLKIVKNGTSYLVRP